MTQLIGVRHNDVLLSCLLIMSSLSTIIIFLISVEMNELRTAGHSAFSIIVDCLGRGRRVGTRMEDGVQFMIM